MDDLRFDTLSRVFATAPTRRTALAGLAALLSRAFLAPADANAQSRTCRPLGDRCFPSRGLDCCRGECRSGRCRCPEGQRRCGNRCLRKGRTCRRARKRCGTNQHRCQGRCISKNACCGGCSKGQFCRHGGCCDVPSSAALKAALEPGGPDTIRLCPKTTYRGTFTITRPVTVIGAGATSSVLDGARSGTVVTITDAVSETVRLHGLGIVNGLSAEHGGGILARAPLTLTQCRVANNEASVAGGGILTVAALTLIDSVVTRNRSTNLGGGIDARGGGAIVTLRGSSRVEHNEADLLSGGGLNVQVGAGVTLRDKSQVRHNRAQRGGGISITGSAFARLHDTSRVEGNAATIHGGGIASEWSQLELHGSSRITGNVSLAGADSGGGIYTYESEVVLPDAAMVAGNTPDQCWPAIPTGDGGTCS